MSRQPAPDTSGEAPGSPAVGGPLRIAWLVRGDETYGVRRAVLSLLTGVTRRGHGAIVVALEGGPLLEECAACGAETVALALERPPALAGGAMAKVCGWARLRRYERRAAPRVIAALAQREIDVVHVLWPNLVTLGARVARGIGARCVWEMPNVLGAAGGAAAIASRAFYQWRCWRGGVTVLANSAYTATSFGHWPVRPTVMHLGADAERFDPQGVTAVTRDELGIPADAAVLGIVGRVDPSKGQERLIAALGELAEADEPGDAAVHLLLVGGSSDEGYERTLRATAGRAGIAGCVHLVGESATPERYYGAMDVAVSASVVPESFGLSVVEAMLMARPVLAHALGGPAETVVDGRTGWHVHDASVAGWTRALRRVLADRARWPAMGEAARSHALERFTLDAQARRYLGVIQQRAASPHR